MTTITTLPHIETFKLLAAPDHEGPLAYSSSMERQERTETETTFTAVASFDFLIVKNIQNQAEIIKTLKSPDKCPVECCVLDMKRIVSLKLLKLAMTRAIMLTKQNRPKTRSIFTEILLALSPTTSISDAFKFFGISSKTRNILVLMERRESTDGTIIATSNAKELLSTFIKGDFQDHNPSSGSYNSFLQSFLEVDRDLSEIDRAALLKIYNVETENPLLLERRAISLSAIQGL